MLHRGRHFQDSNRNLVIIFSVADIFFALQAQYLVEIIQVSAVEPEMADDNFVGSVNLRGWSIPVFNFRKFMQLSDDITVSPENTALLSMLVLRGDPGESKKIPWIGIEADHISGVVDETECPQFGMPDKVKDEQSDVYKGILLREDTVIYLLNIPWLVDTFSPLQ
ncbi:MAG: chemotaxis protein CheW [Deltaproteobacteria bacterium]|nr:chemotaxis protein CheW [Candidatus Zymogenaceae bacterium]